MSNHEKIRVASEQAARELFEQPLVRNVANRCAQLMQDCRVKAGQGEDARRRAGQKWMEAGVLLQADGGRLVKAQGNSLMSECLKCMAEAEALAAEAEVAWAELAHKLGCYVPHGRRLEVCAQEQPGWVYCWDADSDDVGLHQADACPPALLRFDKGTVMLFRMGTRGRFNRWPGRKD